MYLTIQIIFMIGVVIVEPDIAQISQKDHGDLELYVLSITLIGTRKKN